MAAPSGKELDGKDRVRLRLHLREVANELYVGVAGIQCHDAGGEREHYSVTTLEASARSCSPGRFTDGFLLIHPSERPVTAPAS